MNKICIKCNKAKDIDQFSWRKKSKNLRMSWCKPCVKEYDSIRAKSESYRATKKIQVAVRVEESRKYREIYLQKNPCIKCGIKDTRVLEFDHRDGVVKRGNVSEMIANGFALKSIIEEIAKCDVLCANCHRLRTLEQFDRWSWRNRVIPVEPMIATSN